MKNKHTSNETVFLFGASGTIGRAVLEKLEDEGRNVIPVYRDAAMGLAVDVSDMVALTGLFEKHTHFKVISCLASRTGAPDDAWQIDYQANANILAATHGGCLRFILLSAICVQKPKLEFQKAKLAFEKQLQEADVDHVIIRPTAFFKSLSGQMKRVKDGKPFLVFGNGELTRCKPISDRDLATYIVEALDNSGMVNKVLPIGGSGPAITPKQQGQLLFHAAEQPMKFRSVPIVMFKLVEKALNLLGVFSKRARKKAEFARIAQYYAMESMLLWDATNQRYDAEATPEFGRDTLEEHYEKLLRGEIDDQRGDHAMF